MTCAILEKVRAWYAVVDALVMPGLAAFAASYNRRYDISFSAVKTLVPAGNHLCFAEGRVMSLANDSSANTAPAEPIDAVITWVDGSDPVHREKRRAYRRNGERLSVNAIPGGRSETRFASSGELRYCIYSIRNFMPWVRTIHVVTDNQCPEFLDKATRKCLGVAIVDHSQIFEGYEWALPTFNSRTIETVLHRIDGLAERYVYFNDDFIVLKPCTPEDFFLESGVVLRGRWKKLHRFGRLRLGLSTLINHFSELVLHKVRSMHVLAEQRGALLAGMDSRFLEATHTPYPVRKKTIEGFFATDSAALKRNINYKFRDMGQFLTIALAAHLEIVSGAYETDSNDDALLLCFNRDSAQTIKRKIEVLRSGSVRFLCVQGFERARPEDRKNIGSFLEERLGNF